MQTVGWWVGDREWAYKYLAEHVIGKLPEYRHRFNQRGDVNVICAVDLLARMEIDKTMILHLDSNRWYDNAE